MADAPRTRRPWLAEDVARMINMRERQGMTWDAIDAAMGRAKGGSLQKYTMMRDGPAPKAGPQHSGDRVAVSQAQEIERRKRQDAGNDMTLTAAFFGDPPPGFSALDRRRP